LKAQERTYGKDEAVFREGDPSDAVYVVVSGRIELSKQGPVGPVVLAMLGPLEMFGEMGIFDDGPRSATARAAEKSRIRVIPKEEFKIWLNEEPGAALRVIRVLAERLRAADAIIAGRKFLPDQLHAGTRVGLEFVEQTEIGEPIPLLEEQRDARLRPACRTRARSLPLPERFEFPRQSPFADQLFEFMPGRAEIGRGQLE